MTEERKIKIISYTDLQTIEEIKYINQSELTCPIQKWLFSGFGKTGYIYKNVTEETIKKLESEGKL